MALAPSWSLETLVAPTPLYGANGMTWGPDGRLYVAQGAGNKVSAIDNNGVFETIIPYGSPIIAPDDLVFDGNGTMFITDPAGGAVWRRSAQGLLDRAAPDLPAANGIAIRGNHVFVNECRAGGRLVELTGDTIRVILEDLAAPNGMAFGPDGRLYYPLVFVGEVWAVNVEGGRPERILDGLTIASAVKFSASGKLTVTSAATGVITQLDMATGARSEIRTRPGSDNLLFDADDRLIVSYFSDGGIVRLEPEGGERLLAPRGLIEPSDVAVAADGAMFIADAAIKQVGRDGAVETLGTYTDPGFPGKVRGLAVQADGHMALTTAGGTVALYNPRRRTFATVAEGLGALAGIACTPEGDFIVAQPLAGRVVRVGRDGSIGIIAEHLARPTGIASTGSRYLVAESAAGRVIEIGKDGEHKMVATGFASVSGIAVSATDLFILDPAARSLFVAKLDGGDVRRVASGLPLQPIPATLEAEAPRPVHAVEGDEADPNAVLAVATSAVVHFIGITLDAKGRVCVPTDDDGGVVAFAPVTLHARLQA